MVVRRQFDCRSARHRAWPGMPSRRRGTTLVEVLVSIFVMAIGLVALLSLFPLGAFEMAPFDAGTTAVARAVAELSRAGALMSIAGGGDTIAALSNAGASEDFSYISTAGGAFLEWLEGCELPGVAALTRKR